MAVKTPVVDRIPTYPGRVKLTPVSGQADTYDLTRADQPIEEGTPINKALFDQKAYCLTGNTIVYVSKSGNDQTGDGTSSAPYLTIQKAVDSLPKWLDGYMATISIGDGTYNEKVEMSGFQGGILSIGDAGLAVTVRGLQINACSIVRIFTNITKDSSYVGAPLIIRNGSRVGLVDNVVIDVASYSASGIQVESGSELFLGEDFFGDMKTTIKNSPYYAVYASGGSKVQLANVEGSNNSVGFWADGGSIISYGASSLSATTAHSTTYGGRIYSGAQTKVPNY